MCYDPPPGQVAFLGAWQSTHAPRRQVLDFVASSSLLAWCGYFSRRVLCTG